MPKNLPNIVNVSAHYPPFLGGLERVAEEVSKQLAKDNYQVTVLTSNMQAKNMPRVENFGNLTIKRLPSFHFAHTTFIPRLLWELLKVKKPAIYHLHLAQAFVPEMVWLASKLRGIPYVIHFHIDVEPSGPLGGLFVLWKRFIQTPIIKGAARVIALSPEQVNLIMSRYGKTADQVIFLSNGVSSEFLSVGKTPRAIHTPLRLLFVGRLSIQKRPDRIVEALASIKTPVVLDLVGDGEEEPKLKALVDQYKLNNVNFRGRLSGQLLLEAYREADVFILPSDKEGMPLALLEAMAAGLPIVASDVLGIKELVQGVGKLVNPPTPENFASSIESLTNNSTVLINMSDASIVHAKKFTWEKLVHELENVYLDIIGGYNCE